MNNSNISVPPPFGLLPPNPNCNFVIPAGMSCVKWDSTGQIITSSIGGCVFGIVLTLCLRLLKNRDTIYRKKISFKLPSTIDEEN